MDQTPYRILCGHCLTFTSVFFFSLKIPKTRGGWGIASKKHHGDGLLLGNVRGPLPSCAALSKVPSVGHS